MSTPNSIVSSIEGEVAYTDGTKDAFGASIDAHGNIKAQGTSTAFADALTRVKGMFTKLGGSLTASPVASTKTVSDVATRFEVSGSIDDGTKFEAFAEYTAKSGTYIGNPTNNNSNTGYTVAVTNFKTTIQSMLSAIAGVAVTIT